MLHFTMKPPFPFGKLLQACQDLISGGDINILKAASISGEYGQRSSQLTLKRWQNFDTALRNELVKIRAARRHVDFLNYIRESEYEDFSLVHIAMNAYRNPSILEGERMLDRERWHFLEKSALGHYFDLDFLIIYALKLLILDRWETIYGANAPRALEETLLKS